MEMVAADKVAADVADLDKAEEPVMVAPELPANARDCVQPLAITHLTADKKEPLIKCEQHGTE